MLIVNYKHNVRKEREQTMSKIKKLTDYSHLRHRIHMYLGGTDPHTQQILEIVNGSPELKTETWTPALYTGFREILDNASDEVVGHGHGTKIDVTYDPDKKIFSVEDDGRGIPFDYSEEYGMHLATMVLSEPRTGRNFDERKKVAGTNGIGSSATSNTSEWFKFKIIKDGKVFEQEFSEGPLDSTALTISNPTIKSYSNKEKHGTYIKYKPSSRVFNSMILSEEFMYSRIFEFAACNPTVKISYNGKTIKTKSKIEQTLFPSRKTIVIDINDEQEEFESKFIIVPNFVEDGDHYHSIVNNIPAFNGGTHMDAFRLTFFKNMITALEKESKRRKLYPNRTDLTEGLLIYNITNMDGPNFDAQSKTRLTNEVAGKIINKFLNDAEFYTSIIKKNKEWIDEIYKRCEERTKKKDASELSKLQKKMVRTKVPSLMDATGKDRSKCICVIAEGNCLEENTNILVVENNEIFNRSLKEVKIGDQVISHTGNINQIININTKISDVKNISTSYGNIQATSEHKLFVYDTLTKEFSFKKICDIDKINDKLIRNRMSLSNKFIRIINKEKNQVAIDGKIYDFIITYEDSDGNIDTFYSTSDHKIGVFNIISNKLEMIKVIDIEPMKYFIISEK